MSPAILVVQRRTPLKQHVGILVTGALHGWVQPWELFQFGGSLSPLGLLVHLTPQGLKRELIQELGEWTVERAIEDVAGAAQRLRAVLGQPLQYDLIVRNCEHLVSLVETGEAKSPQVRGWATVGALIGLAVMLA